MHSGEHSIPYSLFVSACQRLRDSEQYGVQMVLTLSEKKRDLFSLLWNLHRSDCSDTRDRIAALYGFLPRDSQLQLEYNTSYMRIYKQHASGLVGSLYQNDMILHLFQFGPVEAPQGSEFPSWVPDWSNQRNTRIRCLLGTPDETDYRQSSSIPRALQAYQKWRQNYQLGAPDGNFANELKLWKQWLDQNPSNFPLNGETKLTGQSYKIRAPCTLLSIRKNDAGRELLNLRWVNPWAGLYGRTISKVINIPQGFDGNSRLVAECFMPLKESLYIQNSGQGSNNLPKLALLVESVMVWYSCMSLRHWEGSERRLVVYETLRAMFMGKTSESKSLVETFSKSQDTLPQTIDAVIADLGSLLHDQNSVFVEIEEEKPQFAQDSFPEFDYAFGPSTLRKGMLLLPLASHLPDYGIATDRVTWSTNYTDYNFVEKKRFKSGYKSQLADPCNLTVTLTNLIAANPVDKVGTITAPGLLDKLQRMGKYPSNEVARAIPPLKATYVCPCLGVIYRHSWFIGRDSKESFVSPGIDSLRAYWKDFGDTYARAAKEGKPPPFTIDLI